MIVDLIDHEEIYTSFFCVDHQKNFFLYEQEKKKYSNISGKKSINYFIIEKKIKKNKVQSKILFFISKQKL